MTDPVNIALIVATTAWLVCWWWLLHRQRRSSCGARHPDRRVRCIRAPRHRGDHGGIDSLGRQQYWTGHPAGTARATCPRCGNPLNAGDHYDGRCPRCPTAGSRG